MLITLITFQIDIKECFGLSKVSNIINGFITTLVYSFSKSDLKDLLLAFDYFLSNEMLPYTTRLLRPPPRHTQNCLSTKSLSQLEIRPRSNEGKRIKINWIEFVENVETLLRSIPSFFCFFSLIERKKKPSAKKVKQLHVLLRQRVAKNRHNLLQKNFHSKMRFIYLKTIHNTTNFFRSQFVLIKLVSPRSSSRHWTFKVGGTVMLHLLEGPVLRTHY